MHSIERTYENDDGEEIAVELPALKEVCPDCEGHGSVLNPSMRYHCYTQEEFNETFWEPEDREQYFKRGGIYDVQCPTCHGRNVVDVIDEARFTAEQRAHYVAICKRDEQRARWEAEERHEREMGY